MLKYLKWLWSPKAPEKPLPTLAQAYNNGHALVRRTQNLDQNLADQFYEMANPDGQPHELAFDRGVKDALDARGYSPGIGNPYGTGNPYYLT